MGKTIYCLYRKFDPLPRSALVLSFMMPAEEDGFSRLYPDFLRARKEMDNIREKARLFYIDMIARISATPCRGKTLRQALNIEGKGNPWWYHKASERDMEADGTFNMILQILTVFHACEQKGATDILVCGGPLEVVEVLRSRYAVKSIRCRRIMSANLLTAVFSRLKYLREELRSRRAIMSATVTPEISADVALQGFWNGSVESAGGPGEFRDKYFKSLPDELAAQSISCLWLLWLGPFHSSGNISLKEILRPAAGNRRFVFAQRFLKSRDIIKEISDFRPFLRYLRYSRLKEFRLLFKEGGFDFRPLFRGNLFLNFCNSCLPQYYLKEAAYKRAFCYYKPKLSLAFLDFFLTARAFNQAAAHSGVKIIRCNMQHASYGREKTIILMDNLRDFQGRPDNFSMPAADYFFTMGGLCKDILIEEGLPKDKIFVTGSSRYDDVKVCAPGARPTGSSGIVKILIIPTLNLSLDIEMVEAAVLAASGLPNVRLYLRNNPRAKMDEFPLYKAYADKIALSAVSLDEDLNSADLVLFTYSTAAEEALLRGLPLLRWQANGFNGSVFRDINSVRSVYSVETLRRALESFMESPSSWLPEAKLQELVLERCFYRADGESSLRIARKAEELLALR